MMRVVGDVAVVLVLMTLLRKPLLKAAVWLVKGWESFIRDTNDVNSKNGGEE